jgi:hypothetical protein
MTNPIISDIARMLSGIPKDTAPALLSELLRPVLELALNLDEPTRMAIIYHDIKNYFNLTLPEVKSYEKLMKSFAPKEQQDEFKEDSETIGVIDNLIHWVQNPGGKVKFLMDANGQMEIKETVLIDNKPRNAKQDMRSMMLPTEDIINMKHDFNNPETAKKLLSDISLFVYDCIELPKNKYYLIIALYVLHTYLLEKLESSPFLYMYGTPETGKSRAGKTVAALAFRCKRETTPTGPVLFRSTHFLKMNYVFDEIQLRGDNGNQDVKDLLKNRYTPGCTVTRIERESEKNLIDQIKTFDTYGGTMICSTEYLDNIIESRCLKFVMKQNKRQNVEPNLNLVRAAELRNRLLFFRHYWMRHDFPHIEPPARRRLGELLTPLYTMLQITDPSEANIKEWDEFVLNMKDKRKEADSHSQDAEGLAAINKVIADGKKQFTSKEVHRIYNEDKPESYKKSEGSISKLISRLGFDNEKTHSGRHWIVDHDLIKQKMEEFDMDHIEIEQGTNVPSAPVQTTFLDPEHPF